MHIKHFFLILFLFVSTFLRAGPQNGVVIEGHASFHSLANGMEIQTGKQTVIHWDSFSIDLGEVVRFCQNSEASAVLNRVIGTKQSLIDGLLESNGHVFLLNQNGILVGKDGVIDTASFIGSTLDLSNDEFLKGKSLLFQGKGVGNVINHGTIHARLGDVFLIGYQVENTGDIQALSGTVGLAQGAEVLLAMQGEERLFVRKRIDAAEGGVSNQGAIRAAEVEIKASGNPFALAIHQGGEIDATGVQHRNGRVLLIAEQGKTQLNGTIHAPAGEVQILGNEVQLTEVAEVDVSGNVGGSVLIGGDFRGSNEAILNADATRIDLGAKICADGLTGDGGKVIVWSKDQTHYYGDIFARALGNRGDGGLVEVSSKSNDYQFKGGVNASSINGQNGQLLLDPVRIRVRNATSSPPFPTSGAGTYMPSAPPNTANLDIDDIVSALNSGTDVTIESTGSGTGNGDIDFQASFSWTGTGNLSATAYRNVTVTGATTITSTSGNITFIGQGNGNGTQEGINLNGDLVSTSGAISLTGTLGLAGGGSRHGVQITGNGSITTGGNISINGTARSTNPRNGSNGVFIQGTVTATGAATVDIIGNANANTNDTSHGIDITGTVTAADGLITLIGATLASGDNSHGIDITSGDVTVSGSGGISLNGTGSTALTGDSYGVNLLNATNITSSGSGAISIDGQGGVGPVGYGVIVQGGASVSATGAGDVSVTGVAGTASGDNYGVLITDASSIVTAASGSVSLDGTGGSGAGGTHNVGAYVVNGGTLSSTSGTVSITGVGGNGTADNHGVELTTTGVITSPGGLTLNGRSSNGTTSRGVLIPVGVTAQTSGAGSISITGNSSAGTGSPGVEVAGTATALGTGNVVIDGMSSAANSQGTYVPGTVSAGDGGISVQGAAAGTGVCDGIVIEGPVSTTGNGAIDFVGNSSIASATSDGIDIRLGGSVTSFNGDITMQGTSQGSGADCGGIEQQLDGSIASTGGGTVTLIGIGSVNGTDQTRGVKVTALGTGPSSISVNDGDLVINGFGSGSGIDGEGFLLGLPGDLGSFVQSTGMGNITINGTGSSTGTSSNPGVNISSGLSVASLGSGSINMSGQGGAGSAGYGIIVQGGADVTASGTGNVLATGVAGTASGDNYGVLITDASSIVNAASGNVSLDGTGGSGAGGTHNVGAYVVNGGTLSSTSGTVSITGVGGNGTADNHGVELTTTGVITSLGGLTLNGTSSSGTDSRGVFIPTGITTQTSGTGSIGITGISSAGAGSPAVEIAGTATVLGTGNVVINGTSSGSAATSPGVFLTSGVVNVNTGNIQIDGIGNTGAALSEGVSFNAAALTSLGGNISITGTGQDTSGSPTGIGVISSTVQTTGAGTVNLTTLAGDLTDSGAGGSAYTTQTGTLTFVAAEAIRFSAIPTLSTFTTTLGTVNLDAQGSDLVLGDSGSVSTSGGTANLTAANHIRLGVVNVTNTGDIVINAGGQVSDNAVAPVNLIGNRAFISSGETGSLPTTLNQIQAFTAASALGNESITIVNSQALEIDDWSVVGNGVQTASNGVIDISTASGGITVSNAVVGGGSATVTLSAAGATVVSENVSSTSGAIAISGTSVTHNGNGSVVTGGGGTINATATTGNLIMNPGISFTTGGGGDHRACK